MIKRFGIQEGIISLIPPAALYATIAFSIMYSMWPYFYYVKNETIIVIGVFASWRYGWQFLNYTRSAIYSLFYYPKLKRTVHKFSKEHNAYPDHIYFVIPSYKEEPWVTVETFQSILSNLATIPSKATIVVATGADLDDSVISTVFQSHPVKDKVELVLQRQSEGKRIAMGHALRAIARRYNDEENSITIFMDGDSYLENHALNKTIPFFSTFKDLGALTTNEIAYINTHSQWYKDWFNLKFGQRHVLFQSHALSNKVLTLTGRFSIFRTSIVVSEDFIRQIENDTIDHWCHGRFRFLMGDDKSSWFYLLKHGWKMLYIPDVVCYSLESRDAKFSSISFSLPYRWFGNTLRNNARALALGRKTTGTFIWFAILDQRISMWTSLVGITGAIILSISKSFIYLPFYIGWVLFVRVIQMTVIALRGHPVSLLTIPLMLYNQWVGAVIKIRSYYHLSDQKWSKGTDTQESGAVKIKHPLANFMPGYGMIMSYAMFMFALLLTEGAISMPDHDFFGNNKASTVIHAEMHGVTVNDQEDDSAAVNDLLAYYSGKKNIVISLPDGVIDLMHTINIPAGLTLQGRNNTRIVSHIQKPEYAVLNVQGSLDNYIGVLSTATVEADTDIYIESSSRLKPGDLLLLKQSNTDAFLKSLGSKVWNKQFPYLRQTIVRVKNVQGNKIQLEKPIGTMFTANATKIFLIQPVRDVSIKNLHIEQRTGDQQQTPVAHDYSNSFTDFAVDTVHMQWAADCRLENLVLINSGRHPVSLDSVYNSTINNIDIDGAWNKGKQGHGYVKFSRTYWSQFTNSKIKNIRHVVLQWSSSSNLFENLQTSVDINLHGGYVHNNTIRNIRFTIPDEHPWKGIVTTASDAHWAPPDGKNTILLKE